MTAPPVVLSDRRKKFLLDIFNTALEGGIGYWSAASVYHWSNDDDSEDIHGFYAVIHPPGEEGGWGMFPDKEDTKALRIDLEVIARGVKLFRLYCLGVIDGKGQLVPHMDQIEPPLREDSYWWQFLEADMSDGKSGDYDADVADAIVQWGLFGEVVYG